MNDYSQIIGKNIAEFRKEKKLTQEQLGETVGVSGQAVSKWENGGMPDTYLLPELAKALGVTVDRLFELEPKEHIPTLDELLNLVSSYSYDRLHADDAESVFKMLLEAVYRVNYSAFERSGCESVWKIINDPDWDRFRTSQLILDEGTTYISLLKDLPFLCIVKDEPQLSDKLLGEKDYCELFGLLSDPDGLKAAIYTQSVFDSAKYTVNKLAENMKIPPEKLQELLPKLIKFRFLNEEQLIVDENEFRTYNVRQNNEFRPLLIMAYLLINSQQSYFTYSQCRDKQYIAVKKTIDIH